MSKHHQYDAQHLVKDIWAKAQIRKAINLREVLGAFSINNGTGQKSEKCHQDVIRKTVFWV